MNCLKLNNTTKVSRILCPLLLGAALLSFTMGARAEAWTFNLVNAPVAINIDSPGHESIRMTGAGTFDPVTGAVQAGGAYELFNAFDHPNGPIVRGTWYATGFVSFEDGVLKIEIAVQDNTVPGIGTGEMWISTEGIAGPIYAGEPYRIPAGGSGGGAQFHSH